MAKPANVMIHEFEPSTAPIHFDDEGDQLLGFYYQFTDAGDQPLGDLIGPYSVNTDAERAAMRAFNSNDF